MTQNLLNEHQAARFLNLSVTTLRNWRHLRRGVPYIRVGRSVRYCIEDLERYIETRKIDPEKHRNTYVHQAKGKRLQDSGGPLLMLFKSRPSRRFHVPFPWKRVLPGGLERSFHQRGLRLLLKNERLFKNANWHHLFYEIGNIGFLSSLRGLSTLEAGVQQTGEPNFLL